MFKLWRTHSDFINRFQNSGAHKSNQMQKPYFELTAMEIFLRAYILLQIGLFLKDSRKSAIQIFVYFSV